MENKNSNSETSSLIKEAFGYIQKHTPNLNPVTDKLFLATLLAGKLEISVASTKSLSVRLADAKAFEIAVPFGISTFRTILARLAVICRAASEKGSFRGRLKSRLRASGIIRDVYAIERRGQTFIFKASDLRGGPGSGLYGLDDVSLKLRDRCGKNYNLKLTTKNELGNFYLRMERT